MPFAEKNLVQNDFLNGRVKAYQPLKGYRAGVDPVVLAASVPAVPGDSVLELGCGVGVAALCLNARVPGLTLTGLEVQADYADLARRNAEVNAAALTVVTGDLAQMPPEVRAQSFDHVIANPPYFQRQGGTPAPDQGREKALGEDTPLSLWIDTAIRRLKPGGWLTMINRVDRLPDALSSLDDRMGNIAVLPLAPRAGRMARLFLLRAQKGGRGAFVLLAPVVLHEGAQHDGDRESYTDEVRAVLRNGAALDWKTA